MDSIVQPAEGVAPLVAALGRAAKTIDVIIFRLDLKEVEKALETAVGRGVTVSRTAENLVRYHGKLLIVDREELHVYGFNYTAADLRSRSFGIVTRERRMVQEALRLFEADATRQEFEPLVDGFVVSPENAREQLATFIKHAKKSLAIYDPKLTDTPMLRLLQLRARAGVDIRVLGKTAKRGGGLRVQKLPGLRLHVRAMIRDGDTVFVGSQSLRPLELDGRREVGLIARDPGVVKRLQEVFEEDWMKTDLGRKEQKQFEKDQKLAMADDVAAVIAER